MKLSKKADKIYLRSLLANHNQIFVNAGKCRYDFKCHLNAVHEAIENKDKKIAVCIYISKDDEPILHFLNYQKDKFFDNTLGHHCSENKYFFVKWVYAGEFSFIGDIFQIVIDEWRAKLPWHIRWFTKHRV